MKKLILLEALILLIPATHTANVNVNIVISRDDAVRQSHASGSESSIIDNVELETFQLYDGKLKDAIEAYYGKQPDDVYVKSRTPWGDLYTTYNWPQVYRTLTAITSQIISKDYETVEVITQYINNTSNKNVINKVELRKELENTIESHWHINAELTGINIHYDIAFKSDFGETALHYDSLWGKRVKKSEKIIVGPPNDVEITLKPGQRAKAILKATKGDLKVRIDYAATLSGSIAVNYNKPFKGHHFYNMDVNEVISAGGLSRTVPFSEVLAISYYSDYKVTVKDVDTNEILN